MPRFSTYTYRYTTLQPPNLVQYDAVAGNVPVAGRWSRIRQRFGKPFFWLFVLCCVFTVIFVPIAIRQTAYKNAQNPQVMVEGWEVDRPRDMQRYIQIHKDTRILKPNVGSCLHLFELLIVVCSATDHFHERAAIRATWGSIQRAHNRKLRIVFLLGRDKYNSTKMEAVMMESEKHQDIIQEDFIDSYNNLTLKSVMMLKSVTSYCPNARYILKTDDDMYIHVPNLMHLIYQLDSLKMKEILIGHLICDARPITDVTNKWFCPKYMFSGSVYPHYLSGTTYLMDRVVAAKLLAASMIREFFHLEDIYITGMCSEIARIKPRDHGGFSYLTRPFDPCLYLTSTYLISSHRISPEHMRKIWKEIQLKAKNESACSEPEQDGNRLIKLPVTHCSSHH